MDLLNELVVTTTTTATTTSREKDVRTGAHKSQSMARNRMLIAFDEIVLARDCVCVCVVVSASMSAIRAVIL